MDGFHLTRDLLRAINVGELPPRTLVEVAWKHLLEVCPHCRKEWDAWQAEREAQAAVVQYDRAFASVEKKSTAMDEGAREAKRARRDFSELMALPFEIRKQRIMRANKRFKSVVLAEMFLATAKAHFATDAKQVWECAETAHCVLLHTPLSRRALDARVRSLAYMGNGLRANGDLAGADRLITQARVLIRSEGVTSTEVYAEIDLLEGGLRKNQRRLKESEELLSRSASLYQLVGQTLEATRTLVVLGALYYYQGNLAGAISTIRDALHTLSPEQDPFLYLCARHNLALFLCESGAFAEAADSTREDAPFYARFGERWKRLRLRQDWLHGKIATGFGHFDDAERAFIAARDGFLDEGVGYDVALVSLDFALVLLLQGRTDDLKQLATALTPVLLAEDLHQEAAVALLLFQKAAWQEKLSRELIEKLSAFLKEVRENPELRFSATS